MVLTMEDLCNHINRAGKCGCSSTSSTYAQSLSEIDFERGIWQAALDGDVNRVRKFLDKFLVNRILKAPINSSMSFPSPPPYSGKPTSIQLSSVCRDE